MTEIKRVDVSMPEVLLVKTDQGSEITFGIREIDQQLLRWHRVFETGQRVNKALASLDLAVSNSVPATWIDIGTVPQLAVKPPKVPRNRKKHV
jgi:hypothetical protein